MILSFARYVAARKGEASARSREGAAYAYAGDIKVRAALDRVRPVTLAVEAAVRLWQSLEKSRMLGTAIKVTPRQFPKIAKLAERCADTLRIPLPTLYVSPNIGSLNAHTFGTAEDPYIVINAALIDHFTDTELLDVIGHECGHIQNNHVVYMTTLHFLSHAANAFLRWSVRPAVLALNGWARRAEITCDRAGLICTRDLDASIGCLVKLALGSHKLYSDVNLDEYLAQLDEAQKGVGRFDELTRTHPYLPKRVAALAAVRGDDVLQVADRQRARRHGRGGRGAVRHVQTGLRRQGRRAAVGAAMSESGLDARKQAIRRRTDRAGDAGRPGRAAVRGARHPRDALAQAGRRTVRRRRAGRVQSRQIDVHQRAAGRAAAADGHHADDGGAVARVARGRGGRRRS